jgi:hypothetical protein
VPHKQGKWHVGARDIIGMRWPNRQLFSVPFGYFVGLLKKTLLYKSGAKILQISRSFLDILDAIR